MINFVENRFKFFLISGILILVGIISLAVFRLQPGVDFASGSSMTLKFEQPVQQGQLRDQLTSFGVGDSTIQRTPNGDYLVRTREISTKEKEDLQAALQKSFGKVDVLDFNSVSPVIAADTARDAGIAVAVASVLILAYIAWAFRKLPKPWRWGVSAIIPLIHDVFIVITAFSLMGWILGMEIDALFITGLLAVVGYSINNTIVVFDRIRDNSLRGVSRDFRVTVNSAVQDTLARSLNTSLTTLFVIVALFLFGGTTIRNFMLVLLIGVIAGTYSASCIAPQLLVVWDRGEWGKFVSWLGIGKNKE